MSSEAKIIKDHIVDIHSIEGDLSEMISNLDAILSDLDHEIMIRDDEDKSADKLSEFYDAVDNLRDELETARVTAMKII